jgi:hypothetical protein
MELPVSARIQQLVANGIITVDAHLTQSGYEVWGRPVHPMPRFDVFPHFSYELPDLEDKLSSVSVTHKDENKDLVLRSKSFKSETIGSIGSLSEASSRIREKDLLTINVNGVLNKLPEDSLTFMDLCRVDHLDLIARMLAVAEKLGNDKLVSRITTNRNELTVDGASDLKEWWLDASPDQRFILLSTNSKIGKAPVGSQRGALSDRLKGRLASVQCPFRITGTALGPQTERETHEPGTPESYSSSDL